MGYLHINNLYKDQRVLAFKECYALEKVHGTSAHVRWTAAEGVEFHSGENHEGFVATFDVPALGAKFAEVGIDNVTVYGEAYGGKIQRMSETYGKELRFIAFDVKVGESWMDVPDAARYVQTLGLEFVSYDKGPATVAWLDAQRDIPSRVGVARGCGERPSEGVVIRPTHECSDRYGRIIAKHKGEAFKETRGTRPVKDPNDLAVLAAADAIAEEWVTDMRLTHVLDKFTRPLGMEQIPQVMSAMLEDVTREASGEIVESPSAAKAIRGRTAVLFKARVHGQLHASGA